MSVLENLEKVKENRIYNRRMRNVKSNISSSSGMRNVKWRTF